MSRQRCAECADLAPELAMGLVTGQDRAVALAHLQECAECREHLSSLTQLQDRLRTLIPPVEPPVGFEARVLDRIDGARPTRSPWPPPRWVRLSAAVAAVAAIFAGGWALGTSSTPQAPTSSLTSMSAVLSAPLQAGGHQVGWLFIDSGSPSWIYMYLDTPAGDGRLTCTLLREDRSEIVSFPIVVDDAAFWEGPLPADPRAQAAVAEVQITDNTGRTIATAEIPRTG